MTTNRRSVLAAMAALGLTGCASAPVRSATFEGSAFTVCRYDAAQDSFRLMVTGADGAALRSLDKLAAALGPEAKTVLFAMNAGMFDADGLPIGLYVENGVQKHPLNQSDGSGNFYMKPNGVFSVQADGTAAIETADVFAQRIDMPAWATQSGPMLVIGGKLHPGIAPDGASHYIRNAVGIGKDVGTVFVISDEPVSFGKLARFLRDGLGCRDALYFDGDVPSLWAPSLNRRDVRKPLGPMLVVVAL